MQFFIPMQPPTTTHNAKHCMPLCAAASHCAAARQPGAESHPCQAARLPGPLCTAYPLQWPGAAVGQVAVSTDGRHNDGEWRTTKPDTDNLEKALKDEMTRLHFWRDDAFVCSEVVEKFWADTPGIFIKVVEL
ncbi:MAG: RusA family crossover junction endodeoxyribonuclease [Subdoligranulum sp.]